MKYCADTWFLLELYKKSDKANDIFRNILKGKDSIVIPTVSLMELIRVSIMRGEKLSKIESMLNELKATQKVQLMVLDELVAKEAAKISVSFNVPTVDSIIVGSYILSEADILLSNDEDIKKLSKRKIVNIQSW